MAGQVAGALALFAQVELLLADADALLLHETGDYVIINGTPAVNMLNSPEIDGGIGTIAMCVNMIPA